MVGFHRIYSNTGSFRRRWALRISEVHYHPADPNSTELAAGFTNSDDFEFLEVVNISDKSVSLVGTELLKINVDGTEEGVSFVFANGDITELGPGNAVVVVEDLTAFRLRYGDSIPVAGQWSGQLNNAGEKVSGKFSPSMLPFSCDPRQAGQLVSASTPFTGNVARCGLYCPGRYQGHKSTKALISAM